MTDTEPTPDDDRTAHEPNENRATSDAAVTQTRHEFMSQDDPRPCSICDHPPGWYIEDAGMHRDRLGRKRQTWRWVATWGLWTDTNGYTWSLAKAEERARAATRRHEARHAESHKLPVMVRSSRDTPTNND